MQIHLLKKESPGMRCKACNKVIEQYLLEDLLPNGNMEDLCQECLDQVLEDFDE